MVDGLNFILKEMTALRYFMPLVEEGSRRGVQSRFFVGHVPGKYNCPGRNQDTLDELVKKYNIECHDISRVDDFPGLTFVIECVGLESIEAGKGHKIFSIPYMTDFNILHDRYVDKVDGIIFPSESIAQHYNKDGPKNLYLGSPKYDAELDLEEILEKYGIPDLNNILVVSPRHRDAPRVDLSKIIKTISGMKYRVLVKSRGKEPSPPSVRGDLYFEDFSWYPHTSMELIKASKLVINFSSTTIKECALLGTPVVNLDIKPAVRHGRNFGKHRLGLSFLYEQDFCRQLKPDISAEELTAVIEEMISTDWTASFSETRKKYLFEGNSSKRILDHLGVK